MPFVKRRKLKKKKKKKVETNDTIFGDFRFTMCADEDQRAKLRSNVEQAENGRN